MSRLSRNIVYNVIGQGLVLLLGFIGVKFIYSRLGADAFGVIYFNIVLTGALTTALELGVLSTTIREVAAHYFAEREYVERLIRTASLFYWGLGLALFAILFLAAPFLVDKWINLKTIDTATATTMLRYLSLTTLITLPRALYSSLFQGRQRMELNNGIDVGASALQQLGVILILVRGGDVFDVVRWIAAAAIISTLTYMTIAGRMFGVRALLPTFYRDVVLRNFRFTSHMGALSVLNMVLLQFDRIAVSKLLPIASVGYYSFASTVVVRISFAANAVSQAALPSFSTLFHDDDARGLLAQYRKLLDLLGYGLVPLYAAALFAAVPIYTYIFSRSIAFELLLPTALLCLGYFMYSTVTVPYTFSVAAGRPDIASRSYTLAVFVVIPVTTGLTFLFGMSGAACSWVVYQLFLFAYMIPRIYRQCLRIGVSGWYAHIGRILGLSVVTYGLAWVLFAAPHAYSILTLVIAYIGATAAFLGAAFLMIGPDLRATVLGLPHRLVMRRAEVP